MLNNPIHGVQCFSSAPHFFLFLMNKQTLLLLTLLFVAPILCAQQTDTLISLPPASSYHSLWSVGLTAGLGRNYHVVDMSYMTDYRYSKYAPGSSFGLQLGFSPLRWLTLRVDGVMLQKNYQRSHVIGGTTISLPDTTRNTYINLPVLLMFNVGKVVRLHAYGGGYWGRWLASRRTGTTYGMNGLVSYDEQLDFDSPESQLRDNRSDVGFVWGGGISGIIKQKIEVGVEARWYYGLYDIQKDYMSHPNPRYNTTFVLQGGISYLL